uniref:Peroxin-5 n=1 Tax=Kalanchoe fedtschenkoi TaxID=63787 RepID=A0A7N0TDR3_KALFE
MAMRDLVTGGAACAVPGATSSSNPLGALANALVGSSSKTQERLKEIPTTPGTSGSVFPDFGQQVGLPGSELDQQQFLPPSARGSEFLNQFRAVDHGGFNDAWDDIHRPQGRESVRFQEFDNIYNEGVGSQHQPILDGPPQRVLSHFLHSFVESSRSGVPLHPTPLPVLGLSEGDKRCIRDRSGIMARHIFADKSEDFINAQVNALLSSLDIDNDLRMKGPSRFQELDEYWNESQGAMNRAALPSDRWVSEFQQQRPVVDPNAWAHAFEQQHGANGWASEFEQEQNQMSLMNPMGAANAPNLAAMEQTRMLAETMSRNNDPKFQNSKFLQFVSKMSRGELIMDDNQVKSAPGDWASEFEQQHDVGGAWANQFARNEASVGPDGWANQFSAELGEHELGGDQWVNEFSKLNVQDWADEYSNQVENGVFEDNAADNWAHAYDEFLNEQAAFKQDASRGVYVFSDMNPYVGHPNPLKEGQELFRKGLLSEAVLALEAEVLKNQDNAEGWRLLGIAHAENDDDQQAIAAMMRAQEADPGNLEVLLALGVSHTNELEQAAALKYLYSWLSNHPKYRELAFQEPSNSLHYADVTNLFNEAAKLAPDDADVHIVLGVLYNLSREFDKAIEAFETALKLRPRDYSLWNKLGATQANSVHSADAILAYQQALDLKPNYVRAWANMGISYANQGLYEESIRYYVRALAMNPKADNAWQYLRISLSNSSRTDMLKACSDRNLDLLQKEFPL